MDDYNQIEVPPSFLALFSSPSGHRLLQPMSTVRERYELCEDLAQALTDQASTALFKSGGTEGEVLEKMQLALSAAESPVQPPEARWVVQRLAELLGWEVPQGSEPGQPG
jgi:hypothetical protein